MMVPSGRQVSRVVLAGWTEIVSYDNGNKISNVTL
jgi:hypothetical protein